MKPSHIFGIIVRTIGLAVIVYSLWNIVGGFDNFIENLLAGGSDADSGAASTFSYFAYGIPAFLFGAACFFLADWIVKLAYHYSSS